MSEPFGRSLVGSSAMPFKRNPIQAEKIDSIARALAQLPLTAWHNAAHSLLERTLDDSANRRTLLPEAFLMTDELLNTAIKIISGLNIHPTAIKRNLSLYGPFAATERVLMALVKAGADRQIMHEALRQHALAAWQAVQNGQENPLGASICADFELLKYLSAGQLAELMAVEGYIGLSAPRAREMAERIRAFMHERSQGSSGQL
jgi:adenylosuccinate lyase